MTETALDYDPYDPAVADDPFPAYAAMQQHCPGHYQPRLDLYTVTRFGDVLAILQHPDRFSNKYGPGWQRLPQVAVDLGGVLGLADPPAHSRQRKLVNRAFTPKAMQALEPRVEEISRQLIDAFAPRGEADFVTEYSYLLSITVMAELFGIPTADIDRLKGWNRKFTAAFGASGEEQMAIYMDVMMDFGAYIFGQIAERRAALEAGGDPAADMLTVLVAEDPDTEPLSEFELIGMSAQIIGAGHETLTSFLATLVHLLCTHPGELERLRADRSLIEPAIEEALRYEGPIQGMCRTTNSETDLGGVTIPPDSKVCPAWAAANRDPQRWGDDAGVFRIDRDPKELRQHLAFGFGIHHCLGAPLARMETRIALRHILERLPGLELDPTRPAQRLQNPYFIRGWESLPIRFEAEGSGGSA